MYLYQPFTAPIAIPWVKYFWNAINMAIIGIAANEAPAIMRPKSVEFSACSFAIPREIVNLLVLFNIINYMK